MKKILLTSLVLLWAFISNAQTEMNSQNTVSHKDGSIHFVLKEDQLKLLADQIDLFSIRIERVESNNELLPEIIMPTSHALEYAIINFSACSNGDYSIIGSFNGTEKTYLITLDK